MYLKQKLNEKQKRHGRQISRSIQDKIRVWEYDDFTDYVICLCFFATQQVDSFSTQNNCVGKMKEFYARNRGSYMHTWTHSLNTTKWQTLTLVHALNRCVPQSCQPDTRRIKGEESVCICFYAKEFWKLIAHRMTRLTFSYLCKWRKFCELLKLWLPPVTNEKFLRRRSVFS